MSIQMRIVLDCLLKKIFFCSYCGVTRWKCLVLVLTSSWLKFTVAVDNNAYRSRFVYDAVHLPAKLSTKKLSVYVGKCIQFICDSVWPRAWHHQKQSAMPFILPFCHLFISYVNSERTRKKESEKHTDFSPYFC